MKSRTIRINANSNPDHHQDSGKNQLTHQLIQQSFSVVGSFNICGTAILTVAMAFLFSLASAQNPQDPFVHWELLTSRAEKQFGNQSYLYVLPATYKTDNSKSILLSNLQHSADICNGSSDTNRAAFPYVKYEYRIDLGGSGRFNTWVYVSQRLVPTQTLQIVSWMDSLARAYYPVGLIVDSFTAGSLLKLKWHSPLFGSPHRMGGESLQQSLLQIYPNPSDGKFMVDVNAEPGSSPAATIQVLNTTGQSVYQQGAPVSEGNLHQEVQFPGGIASGIYFVKVTLNDRVYTRQIRYQK